MCVSRQTTQALPHNLQVSEPTYVQFLQCGNARCPKQRAISIGIDAWTPVKLLYAANVG
jgi:hypothetical protein